MGRLLDSLTLGPRRRRRWMERRLRQLDRIDAGVPIGRHGSGARRDWRGPVAGVVAVTAALALAPYVAGDLVPWRVGSDAVAGEQVGGYSLLQTQRDGVTPVAWDTCSPIGFRTSGSAPTGGETLVAEAMAEVAAAGGVTFRDEGGTDEEPRPRRRTSFLSSLPGGSAEPVLVAWTSPSVIPRLEGDVIGLGGPDGTTRASGETVWVSGTVSLDRPAFTELLESSDDPLVRERLRAVVVHELLHLLGLGHVDDPTQLMHADAGPVSLAAGDLAGLARVAPPCT